MRSLSFLSHVMTAQGVLIDPKTVEVVKKCPRHLTPKDIWSFLGLINNYRRFVEVFSAIATPSTFLTKKNAMFEWSKKCEKCFQELKDRLTSAKCLHCREVM